jgi:hypothetical protein
LAAFAPAQAAELIPSVGLTKATDSDDDPRVFGGVALRSGLAPRLQAELGVAYRSESLFDGAVKMQTWPLTASLWVSPAPMLYAGGGLGLYVTTFRYQGLRVPSDESDQQFGVHLGGGMRFPLAPPFAAVDVNGRYVFLGEERTQLSPNGFDPDFWTVSAGLAIKF